jgi:hypothetical protein
LPAFSASTREIVDDQLRATQTTREHHFLARLAGWQRPGFYIYEEGDFLTPTGIAT